MPRSTVCGTGAQLSLARKRKEMRAAAAAVELTVTLRPSNWSSPAARPKRVVDVRAGQTRSGTGVTISGR